MSGCQNNKSGFVPGKRRPSNPGACATQGNHREGRNHAAKDTNLPEGLEGVVSCHLLSGVGSDGGVFLMPMGVEVSHQSIFTRESSSTSALSSITVGTMTEELASVGGICMPSGDVTFHVSFERKPL
jgi:hypothetical protein